MADNFHFDITGASLDASLAIATTHHKTVVAWRVDEEGNRLILYWVKSDKSTPLPAPLEGEALQGFVRSWLLTADYGPEPDHDGDNGKGWRVYNEAWGNIAREWQAFIAIEPTWLEYGK